MAQGVKALALEALGPWVQTQNPAWISVIPTLVVADGKHSQGKNPTSWQQTNLTQQKNRPCLRKYKTKADGCGLPDRHTLTLMSAHTHTVIKSKYSRCLLLNCKNKINTVKPTT